MDSSTRPARRRRGNPGTGNWRDQLLQLFRIFRLVGLPGRRPHLLEFSLLTRRWLLLRLILSRKREGCKSSNHRESRRYDQFIECFHLITRDTGISTRYPAPFASHKTVRIVIASRFVSARN